MPDDIKGIKTVDRPPILPRAAIALRKFVILIPVIVTFFNASLFKVFQITHENSTDIYETFKECLQKFKTFKKPLSKMF